MDWLAIVPVAAITAFLTSVATSLLTHWLTVRREKRLLRFQLGWKYREACLDALMQLAREGVSVRFMIRNGELDVAEFITSIQNYVSFTRARLLPWLGDSDRAHIEDRFKPVEEWLNDVIHAELDAAKDGSPRQVVIPKIELTNLENTVNEILRRNIDKLRTDIDSAAAN